MSFGGVLLSSSSLRLLVSCVTKRQFVPAIPLQSNLSLHAVRHLSVTQRKMVKDNETIIDEFNELVNMTAGELEEWLKQEQSESSGWEKGDGSGETVGHESGRKIIEILKKNPRKDPSKYGEDDLGHMRKVVNYCKRHLAQEETAKQDTK
ncbi:hypothetical protein ABVK25_003799 [Lepraria finkii]|uniref:Uncharacterized protein n=1 Tax=Lepraria finkii TaxID=1340010 RepID=A0ABR4BE99_9LECA